MIAKEATIAEGGILSKMVCMCVHVCVYVCVCPRYFSTGVRALVRGHVWYSNWLVLHIKGHLSHGKRDFNYVAGSHRTSYRVLNRFFFFFSWINPFAVLCCTSLCDSVFIKISTVLLTYKNIFLCVVNYFIKNTL